MNGRIALRNKWNARLHDRPILLCKKVVIVWTVMLKLNINAIVTLKWVSEISGPWNSISTTSCLSFPLISFLWMHQSRPPNHNYTTSMVYISWTTFGRCCRTQQCCNSQLKVVHVTARWFKMHYIPILMSTCIVGTVFGEFFQDSETEQTDWNKKLRKSISESNGWYQVCLPAPM